MQRGQIQRNQQFLWVNKDAHSSELSRSTGSEAKSILRHAQQAGAKRNRYQRHFINRSKHDYIAFEVTPPEENDTSFDLTNQQVINHTLSRLQIRFRAIPNNNIIPGTGIDPFSAAVVPLTNEIHSLLIFARRHISVGTGGYRNDIFLRSNRPLIDTYKHATHQMLTDSIRYEHALWPLLASFSLRMKSISNVPFVVNLKPERYHRKGLAAIREQIDKADDEDSRAQLGTGIHYLICSAGMMQRSEELVMHIGGMLRWLNSMEHTSPSTILHFDLVRSWDNLIAASSGRKPVFASAVFNPGALSEERVRELEVGLEELAATPGSVESEDAADLNESMAEHRKEFLLSGYGFDLMVNPLEDLTLSLGSGLKAGLGQLPTVISPTVGRILEVLLMAKAVWQLPGITDSDDSVWVCKRIRAITYELLSMDCLKSETYEDRTAEAIRIALVIILFAAQYRTVNKARIYQVRMMKDVLMPIVEEDWNADIEVWVNKPAFDTFRHESEVMYDANETLLWLMVTGHWAAQDIDEGLWFLNHAARMAARLNCFNYDHLHQIMDKYLYSKTVQRQSLEAVARTLQDKESRNC